MSAIDRLISHTEEIRDPATVDALRKEAIVEAQLDDQNVKKLIEATVTKTAAEIRMQILQEEERKKLTT